MKKLIVDTNIMFSALLGKSKKIREILFSSEDFKPYSCKFSIVELFKHKDKLIKNSDLLEDEILEIFYYSDLWNFILRGVILMLTKHFTKNAQGLTLLQS